MVVADGANGHPEGAPYDRLIATCAVPTIPPVWLAQLRPGGIIVTNLHRRLVGGSLACLTVREDRSATGHLLDDWGAFMPLRVHPRTTPEQLVRLASSQDGVKRESHVPAPVSADSQAWVVLADLLMGETAKVDITGLMVRLVDPDGSWAYHEIGTGTVEQGGLRRLWDDPRG